MEREEGKSGRQTMVSDLIQSVSQSVSQLSVDWTDVTNFAK